jgi:hypothetical protein
MVYQSFELPPAPDAPLSILSLIKLSAGAYRATFGLSMNLLWLPCLVSVAGHALISSVEAPVTFSLDVLVRFSLVMFCALVCGLFFLFHFVKRSLALKRMVLLSDDSSIPSLAFSNRLGWKAVIADVCVIVIQFVNAVVLIVLGLIAYGNDGIMHSPMRFALLPDLSLPFIAIIMALTAVSFLCWNFSEFFYQCFSVVLATESSDWPSLWRRSCDLSRSAFWRGSVFVFAIEFALWMSEILFSPVAVFNLQAALSGGVEGYATCVPPIWLSVVDYSVEFAILLLLAPFFIILNAYFANNVRIRFDARAGR